jgi:vacuolar-type H+-ATPase subunit I/STV1
MKRLNRSLLIPKIVIVLMIGVMAVGSTGCKSKKKLAQEQAAAEYAEKVQKALADLQAILDDDGTMPVSEMERRLNDIKAMNLNDDAVNEKIELVEEKIASLKEAWRLQKEAEKEQERLNAEKTKYDYINEYFVRIANTQDVNAANGLIKEALKMYSSDDTPVLIIIHQEGDVVDYDKPTTIKKYLNFVKDQKKYDNKISSVKFDPYGQITELELIKK